MAATQLASPTTQSFGDVRASFCVAKMIGRNGIQSLGEREKERERERKKGGGSVLLIKIVYCIAPKCN